MNTAKNIKLGVFLIAALAFLLAALYFIGAKRNLFGSTFTLKARFHNVSGLQAGNNVRFMGIDVGTVKSVNILNDTTVEVIMIIEENVHSFIKKDASASVGTEGLMGSRLINISSGTVTAETVEDEYTIQTVKPVSTDDILRTVDYTSQYTAVLSSELVKTISQINTGKGTLGTILRDSFMADDLKETIAGFNAASKQSALLIADFRAIAGEARNGEGMIGTALSDTAISNNMQRTFANLQQASYTLTASLRNLQQLSEQLNTDEGTIALLAGDSALASDLRNTIHSAREGAEGFNQNMEALKHSFLVRRYFRKLEKN